MKKKGLFAFFGLIAILFLLEGLSSVPFAEGSESHPRSPRITPVVEVVSKLSPAVVNISTERIVQVNLPGFGPMWDPFGGPFWGTRPRTYYQRRPSLGSGFFVNPEGYIVTNAHVVSQASQIVVTTLDGQELPATLIGEDSVVDVAILKVEGEDFPWVPLAESDDLLIGETVVAIGNPFGLSHTVTVGVISALEREITVENRTFPGLIQTDAAINPGNSGGPLVNLEGSVVALNTAVQANAQGISFAIPARRVRNVINEIVYNRIPTEEAIGLEVEPITPGVAEYFGLEKLSGVIVLSLRSGGLAEKSGVQEGDLILEIDGQKVQSVQDYREFLDAAKEESIRLKIMRRAEELPMEVEIPNREVPTRAVGESAGPFLGFTVGPIGNRIAARHGWGLDDGVVVNEVEKDSPADLAGFRPGDLLMNIGQFRIRALSDFLRAMREYSEGPPRIEIRVLRPSIGRPVVITVDRRAGKDI